MIKSKEIHAFPVDDVKVIAAANALKALFLIRCIGLIPPSSDKKMEEIGPHLTACLNSMRSTATLMLPREMQTRIVSETVWEDEAECQELLEELEPMLKGSSSMAARAGYAFAETQIRNIADLACDYTEDQLNTRRIFEHACRMENTLSSYTESFAKKTLRQEFGAGADQLTASVDAVSFGCVVMMATQRSDMEKKIVHNSADQAVGTVYRYIREQYNEIKPDVIELICEEFADSDDNYPIVNIARPAELDNIL